MEPCSKARLCVRLVSGRVVYDGPRPDSLPELLRAVAAELGGDTTVDDLTLCDGDAVLARIEDAGEELTVVRGDFKHLLDEFLRFCKVSRAGTPLPPQLRAVREHKRLLLAALEWDFLAVRHAAPELLADRDFMLAAVSLSGHSLDYAAPELQADRDIALAAVKQTGYSLQYAAPHLKADRDFLLAAMGYGALSCCDAGFRDDREIVLAAVAKCENAFELASPRLRADRDVALAAVTHCGRVLQYASPELRADRDLVLAAVTQWGTSLHCALPDLQADRDLVLAAVAQSGLALAYTAPCLQGDRGVVLVAVTQCGDALKHASPALRADRDVVLVAVRECGYRRWVSYDSYAQLLNCEQDRGPLRYADPKLQADREIVLAAVAVNGFSLIHASPWLQANLSIRVAAARSRSALSKRFLNETTEMNGKRRPTPPSPPAIASPWSSLWRRLMPWILSCCSHMRTR
jgi:hypothetical protein